MENKISKIINLMNKIRSIIPGSSTVLMAAFLSISISSFGQTQEMPNFLIIMTDQQAWDAAGYSGNKNIITPNLDRLAGEGVNFSQAVTPCPVCVHFYRPVDRNNDDSSKQRCQNR